MTSLRSTTLPAHEVDVMIQKAISYLRSRPILALLLFFGVGFTGLNVIAYMHVYRMTHFVLHSKKERTKDPEHLSMIDKLIILSSGVHVPKPANQTSPKHLDLPFQTLSIKNAKKQTLHIWKIPHPGRVKAFLFHGYAGKKEDMLYDAKHFYEMGYEPILADFRGSGDSSASYTTLGVEEAADVKSVIDAFVERKKEKSYVLVGFSMGAVAILRAISEYGLKPTFSVLSCPFDTLLSAVQNRFRLMGIPAFPSAQLMVLWGSLQHGFNGFAHSASRYAKNVETPTLLFQGDRDPRVTLAQSQRVFEALKGKKQMHVFKGLGHLTYSKVREKEWKQSIRAFASDFFPPKRP